MPRQPNSHVKVYPCMIVLLSNSPCENSATSTLKVKYDYGTNPYDYGVRMRFIKNRTKLVQDVKLCTDTWDSG